MTEAPQPRPPLSRARVLIVDDNAQNIELLRAYLEPEAGEIIEAADGARAIDAVTRTPPDLIILDLMMPRMSGFQVCEKLKSDPRTSRAPVLVVTALSEIGDVERARDAGADGFLTKPVARDELLERARELLGG